DFPSEITLGPGQSIMLLNHGMPVRGLDRLVNGRSTFIRANSDQPVYAASLAMYAPLDSSGQERAPTLSEWQTLLNTGSFAGPRDKTPTPPDQQGGELIYGRVAGVQDGSTWAATLTDSGSDRLTIPPLDGAIAYGISTLRAGRLGTEQIQTASLMMRYPDTAYAAHGNYGVAYELTAPLFNPTATEKTVEIRIATPLKEDTLSADGLRFRMPPLTHPFFRGTVYLEYEENGEPVNRYVHLWHRAGQPVDPILSLTLPAEAQQDVRINLIYPPDSAPPQVLTFQTVD
ncbi:MAG: DUF3370 domain-containing protein, partial [Cyanobacteria bacterium P01_D01_bin.128]